LIGQTSQLSGLFSILNSLGLVQSGSSRYDLDGLEENDDQIEYRAFANYGFGRTESLRSNGILLKRVGKFHEAPCQQPDLSGNFLSTCPGMLTQDNLDVPL
jgi:hypothetical protein